MHHGPSNQIPVGRGGRKDVGRGCYMPRGRTLAGKIGSDVKSASV